MNGPLGVFVAAFVTVLTGMGLLTGVVFLLRGLAVREKRAAIRETVPAAPALPDELVAVLAAAASEALGRPLRVHRVHVHREPATEAWSRAGRMDIMVSHRVEPKR